MPMSSRPHEVRWQLDARDAGRFASFPDFKRAKRQRKRQRPHAATATATSSRTAPPESTNAENFYYLKQMNSKTPMVIVMTDGEEIRGWIEWYDKTCLKVNREGAPNLLIQKHCIKYLLQAGRAGA